MTEEEYTSRRSHLRSINPQTADCPPADEIAELRERFIEQLFQEQLDELYAEPLNLQEYIMESSYENTNLQKIVLYLVEMSILPPAARSMERLRKIINNFITETATARATEMVDNL